LCTAEKLLPSLQFRGGDDIFLEERQHFRSNGLSVLARTAAQGLIEIVRNIFDI
jgi:hypothetical protein